VKVLEGRLEKVEGSAEEAAECVCEAVPGCLRVTRGRVHPLHPHGVCWVSISRLKIP
jgi:hypothetical protein